MAEPAETPDLRILPEGHVAVSQDRYEQLEAALQRGADIQTQVATMQFEAAFSAAVSDGRAVPALEAVMRKVFDANGPLALELIAAFPQFVNVAPLGASARNTPEVPDGYDAQNYLLHLKVQAHLRANPSLTYGQALAAVVED
jgi:phage I-like protein